MELASIVVGITVGAVLAVALLFLRWKLQGAGLREEAARIVQDAERQKEQIVRAAEIDAKELLLTVQRDHEREVKIQRDALGGTEKRLREREANVERKNELLERRERDCKKREAGVDAAELRSRRMLEEAEGRVRAAEKEIERIAGLSKEQARQELLAALEGQARKQAAAEVKRIEEEARHTAKERATKIIAESIQRFAGGFVAEKTVSVVELPSDDMKGRIIGREGRNIRAIESATGVDIIIDDTPEVVIISGFNPVRREIAKMALERLMDDGRIHPARIEEVVEQCRIDLEETVVRVGEQATFDLGLHGVHPELCKLLGRLKYRTVNGQNVWNHAVETAAIAGMMATELGLNATVAKRAALLHDIGKAVEHEAEGNHADIGAEHARRFGEKSMVVAAIKQHHDAEPESVYGVLVQAADTLSKARPGARRDLWDTYIKRLEDLERICVSFAGVEKAFAIQAGREVRVMVDYGVVAADEAILLSRDIARRIEDELTYPGEVRITVIREARATEIAR